MNYPLSSSQIAYLQHLRGWIEVRQRELIRAQEALGEAQAVVTHAVRMMASGAGADPDLARLSADWTMIEVATSEAAAPADPSRSAPADPLFAVSAQKGGTTI